MKKLSIFLLALVAGAGTMFAEKIQIGDLYYNLDATNKTAEVTSQNSVYPYWSATIATANIPSSMEYNSVTYTVTSIGMYAFEYCSSLTSVTIPNSVKSIGDEAFMGCSKLPSVTIPDSVTSIGEWAFYDCTGLTSVTIGNSVTSIGDYVFSGCTGLTSVTIPNSVTSIGYRAFWDCTGLTSVEISNSVTSIGYGAFEGCSKLTSVTIPNSVTSIGNDAFRSCSGLTSVTIPDSVTSIGDYAFYECTGLASVTIPNSVTSIGSSAFRDCTGLTSVTNYATTPQSINFNVFDNVNKSTCVLNVPKKSVSLYQAADVWKEFTNIVGVNVPIETIEGDYTIYYVDKESYDLSDEVVTLHVPVAPTITGFTFVEWRASGTLADGITLQAVYQADVPSSTPEVYTNPANPAQKLIRNGNVYILSNGETYTITGAKVKSSK